MAGTIGGSPIGGILSRPYFSTMQPFAYRDTLNMLTWLRAVSCNLDTVREYVNEVGGAVEKIPDDTEKALQKIADDTTAALDALDTTLRALIAEGTATGMAWSPVRGQKDSVQHIFDDMYDNVRVHALFSADYDAMALTAAEYDGVEMEARTYDLWPIDIPNANLGDVADAREHFPRETPIGPPSPDDGDGCYLSHAEAAATYMPLNPQAKLFGEKDA